ncbi:MAG: hypothetical protein IH969_05310 [Candidatus Krumholzibacteriota bacterium]|nr:hypothetical protein [Candidatus Krumholzibacteriota bacterium]
MKKGGLVSASRHKQGERKSRLCTITSAGKKAFRQWLNPPIPSWMAAVEFDPIRARVHFLAMLSERQQQRFIQEALDVLEAEIEATKTLIAELSESGDKWKTWGARGALGVLQARLAWLRDIRASE